MFNLNVSQIVVGLLTALLVSVIYGGFSVYNRTAVIEAKIEILTAAVKDNNDTNKEYVQQGISNVKERMTVLENLVLRGKRI